MQNDSGMPKSGLPDTFPRLPISPGESSARPHLGLRAQVYARRPPPIAVPRPPARALAAKAAAALRVTPPRGVCQHYRGPLSAPCSASFSCRRPPPPYLFILSPQNASAPGRRRFRRELGGQPGPGAGGRAGAPNALIKGRFVAKGMPGSGGYSPEQPEARSPRALCETPPVPSASRPVPAPTWEPPRDPRPPTPQSSPTFAWPPTRASGRRTALVIWSRPPERRHPLAEARLCLPADQWHAAAARGQAQVRTRAGGVISGRCRLPGAAGCLATPPARASGPGAQRLLSGRGGRETPGGRPPAVCLGAPDSS